MERIRCSAPLPEDSADPVLTRMLAPTPYQVPVKEVKEESRKAKGGLHSEGTPDTVSGEIRAPSSKDKRKGGADILSPHGKKRTAYESWEVKAPKRGKMPLSGGSGSEDNVAAQLLLKDKPSAES